MSRRVLTGIFHPAGSGADGGARDALEDRRLRDQLRGPVGLLEVEVRLGGVSAASSVAAADGRDGRGELARAFAAARARLGLIALLLALAAVAWWSTADRMAGMDAGPGTDLGALGWFLGVWVVMMAAMMFPSVAPTVALYTTMTQAPRDRPSRCCSPPATCSSGAPRGSSPTACSSSATRLLGDQLAWDSGGRWFAAGVLAVAAVYELTPLKNVCLTKCRSPLGFLLGSWRDGRAGALRMGAGHGAWCLGCCWALMAALFALGVMSLVWMAFVAALIALEKTLPWRRVVTWGTAAVLLAFAVAVAASPGDVPGFTTPGTSMRCRAARWR